MHPCTLDHGARVLNCKFAAQACVATSLRQAPLQNFADYHHVDYPPSNSFDKHGNFMFLFFIHWCTECFTTYGPPRPSSLLYLHVHLHCAEHTNFVQSDHRGGDIDIVDDGEGRAYLS